MSILRRDDTVTNTLGNAIAGAKVYVLSQPANVSALTPLAPVYSDSIGTPAANPQITDGFGHAVEYLNDGQLYTVVYIYPNGMQVVYSDQFVGSSLGGATSFAGVPVGTIDGTNKIFTMVSGTTPLGSIPLQSTVWLNVPLIDGIGYSLSLVGGQVIITYAVAPQPASGGTPADTIYVQGLL